MRLACGEDWGKCNMGKALGTGGFPQTSMTWGQSEAWSTLGKAVPGSRNSPVQRPGVGAICRPWVREAGRNQEPTCKRVCGKVLLRCMWEALGWALGTRREGVALLVPMSTGCGQTVY